MYKKSILKHIIVFYKFITFFSKILLWFNIGLKYYINFLNDRNKILLEKRGENKS